MSLCNGKYQIFIISSNGHIEISHPLHSLHDHPISECGIRLTDMVYLKRIL